MVFLFPKSPLRVSSNPARSWTYLFRLSQVFSNSRTSFTHCERSPCVLSMHSLKGRMLHITFAFFLRGSFAANILKKFSSMFSIINKSRLYLTLTIHKVRTLPNLSLETSSSWSACKYSFESGPTRSAGFGLVELRDPIDEYPRLYKEQ